MNLFSLFADIKLDTKGFESGVSKVNSAIKSTVTGLNNFSVKVHGYVTKSAAVVSAAGAALATMGVKYNMQIENYTANFSTLLGSTEAAAKRVEELKTMAAKTPFGMEDLASATQTLLAFQVPAEKTNRILSQLGDIALGDKTKLSGLALVYGQVASAGKMNGQDLMQFINQGFNPLNYIAKETGASMSDVKEVMGGGNGSKSFQDLLAAANKEIDALGDNASNGAKMLSMMGSEGAVSVDLVTWAIQKATGEGEAFFNGMDTASKTTAGLISTLKDDTSALIGEVFTPLSDSIREKYLPSMLQYVSEVSQAYGERGLTGVIDKTGDIVMTVVKSIAQGAPTAIKSVGKILTSITEKLNGNAPELIDAGKKIFASVREGFDGAITNISSSLSLFSAPIAAGILTIKADLIKAGGDLLGGIAEGINNDLAKTGTGDDGSVIQSAITDAIGTVLATISTNGPQLVTAGLGIITSIGSGIKQNQSKITDAITTVVGALLAWLSDPNSLPTLLDAGLAIISGVADGIVGNADQLSTAISTSIQSIIEWLADENNLKSLGDAALKIATSIGKGLLQGVIDGVFGNGAFANLDRMLEKVFGSFGMPYERITQDTIEQIEPPSGAGTGKPEFPSSDSFDFPGKQDFESSFFNRYGVMPEYWYSERTEQIYGGITKELAKGFGQATESGVPFTIDEKTGEVIKEYSDALETASETTEETMDGQAAFRLWAERMFGGGTAPEETMDGQAAFRLWAERMFGGGTAPGDTIISTPFGELTIESDDAITSIEETKEAIDSLPDEKTVRVTIITTPFGNLTIEDDPPGSLVDGSHANGLPYVPYDGYIARLHRGERVLTSAENNTYNRNGGTFSASSSVNVGTMNVNGGADESRIVKSLLNQTVRQQRAMGRKYAYGNV